MKAVQYVAPGQVELVEVPVPGPQADEVLVRIDKVAICGSDLHELHDHPPERYPFPPGMTGHECVGVIVENGASGFRPGEHVLILPPQANALAEYVSVAPQWLIPLPDGLAPELALLGQQLGTVIFCCRRLSNVLDKDVVIVGQGPAGLNFTALLNRMGARRVIGLDLVEHRLTVARQMGATYTVNVQEVDPVEAVREITNGQMADLVVEAVGKAETINLCVDLVRRGGEMALFGVPKQPILPLAAESFLRRQVHIVASVGAQGEPDFRSFRLALDMIAQGRLDVAPLISHRLPLTEAPRAFWLAETKADGAVKVVLEVPPTG